MKPKFSEVLRAAGDGYYRPFNPQQQFQQQGNMNGQSMGRVITVVEQQQSAHATSMRDMFYAIAAVYDKYEEAE